MYFEEEVERVIISELSGSTVLRSTMSGEWTVMRIYWHNGVNVRCDESECDGQAGFLLQVSTSMHASLIPVVALPFQSKLQSLLLSFLLVSFLFKFQLPFHVQLKRKHTWTLQFLWLLLCKKKKLCLIYFLIISTNSIDSCVLMKSKKINLFC